MALDRFLRVGSSWRGHMHFHFMSPPSGLTDGIVPVPVSKHARLDTVWLPLAFLSRPGRQVSLPVSWGHLHFGFVKSVHACTIADVQPPQRCEDGAMGESQASCSLPTSGTLEKPGRIPKMVVCYRLF